ncbi:hypothetical protein [Deinococcus depolymerans]|uniref:Uncharacterized protein n=1 Tax=Deinococcus depolymerans TaxID=392408 RepID=A0ABP3LKH3_9DEIO
MDAPEQTPILLGGEPGTWTPAQRSRNNRMAHFLRVLAEEGGCLTACQVAGVPYATVHRWRDEHEAFATAYDIASQRRLLAVEDNIFRIAQSTDPRMANASYKKLPLDYLDTIFTPEKASTDKTGNFSLSSVRPNSITSIADRAPT